MSAFSFELWTFQKMLIILPFFSAVTAYTAAAKSLQSCPTLCDPIDDGPPGSDRLLFAHTPRTSILL